MAYNPYGLYGFYPAQPYPYPYPWYNHPHGGWGGAGWHGTWLPGPGNWHGGQWHYGHNGWHGGGHHHGHSGSGQQHYGGYRAK